MTTHSLTLSTALTAACLFWSFTAAADESTQTLEVGGLTFSFNETWKTKKQARAMSQGGITRPAKNDADTILEADFYHFGRGQGGDVQANVQRWLGQFEGEVEAASHVMEVNGIEITLVKASGTYLDGPPLGEKVARPDYGLLGAIIHRPEEGSVFIKLTGPLADLEEMDGEFKSLVLSAFKE